MISIIILNPISYNISNIKHYNFHQNIGIKIQNIFIIPNAHV